MVPRSSQKPKPATAAAPAPVEQAISSINDEQNNTVVTAAPAHVAKMAIPRRTSSLPMVPVELAVSGTKVDDSKAKVVDTQE